MKLRIEIELGNDAFRPESGKETARILRELASEFQDRDVLPDERMNLLDCNGNKCGFAKAIST